MATIHQQKDYWATSTPIEPGRGFWISWPTPAFDPIGAWTITGTPVDYRSGYYTMSTKEEVHVTTRTYFVGDIQVADSWVGASFHNTGQRPISYWHTVQTCVY
ncbi:hypothetical protein ACIP2Z_33725 [Streptomyces iakyrus]|uniref:Uncharacterized protein n=1 Tax=Streptomyces iakyrus TaxID=68219 RepID=A0ABW8FP88_9ACTN